MTTTMKTEHDRYVAHRETCEQCKVVDDLNKPRGNRRCLLGMKLVRLAVEEQREHD